MGGTHVIVSTHTTRHLRTTLLGVHFQTLRPDSVTVSCDSDAPDIAALVERLADELASPVTLVQRPFQGASRSSQVRNNAVRAILQRPNSGDDLVWFLDGDCVPDCAALRRHAELAAPHRRVVLGFRIDLSQEQTNAISEQAIRDGRPFVPITDGQLAKLRERDARYRRHALLRRFRLVKPHKPKLLSANFSVRLADFLEINGFDEEYVGYGQEDDDLGRRLYMSGVRPIVGLAQAVVYHQYHETRAPGAWSASPNAARFAAPFTLRCARGVENPLDQPAPAVRTMTRPTGG